jgi:hypothetical protein
LIKKPNQFQNKNNAAAAKTAASFAPQFRKPAAALAPTLVAAAARIPQTGGDCGTILNKPVVNLPGAAARIN